MEQYAEAAAVYADVAKRFPQSTIAREAELSAGRWFYRVEKFDDAAPWLRKAFDANGAEAPEAGHWLARIAIRGGKPADHELGRAVDKVGCPRVEGLADRPAGRPRQSKRGIDRHRHRREIEAWDARGIEG